MSVNPTYALDALPVKAWGRGPLYATAREDVAAVELTATVEAVEFTLRHLHRWVLRGLKDMVCSQCSRSDSVVGKDGYQRALWE